MNFRRRQEPDPAVAAAPGMPAESAAAEPELAQPVATEPELAPPVAAEPAPESPADELVRLRAERTALIALCLYARDRASSQAAADRIDARLAEIGVATVRPDGETFDPARHEASATRPTDDPALHNTVAETELPGYSDHGEAVRPPVVSVYQQQTPKAER